MALRAYGNFCFTSGQTLSGFRHTIIAVQKKFFGSKRLHEPGMGDGKQMGGTGASQTPVLYAGTTSQGHGVSGKRLEYEALDRRHSPGFLWAGSNW